MKDEFPRIMMGVPVKDAGAWFKDWSNCIANLTYPSGKLSIVFIYGESSDNTLGLLKEFRNSCKYKVRIFRENYDNDLRLGGIQLGASIYKDFQSLIKNEDFFMLMDCDLLKFDPDLIEKLLQVDAEIVAPYAYCESGYFYDTWVFRINNTRFDRNDPPAKNLDKPIVVDSVGTCFIADAGFFKFADIRNPYPNLTLCESIRKNGGIIVACPHIKVYHKDLEKMGILHYPLAPEFGYYPAQGFITSNYAPIIWDKRRM